MSDKVYYFKLLLKDNREVMLGLKNTIIFKRWMVCFKKAMQYVDNSVFSKPIPVSEQVVELLNDQNGQISFYKRKMQSKSMSPKKNVSIMNLKIQETHENVNNIGNRVS